MKTIYLTKKQVAKKKEEIDEIIRKDIPIECNLNFFIRWRRNKDKKIKGNYDWIKYEKKIDGLVEDAKEVLKSRFDLIALAKEKEKLLNELLRVGTMTTKKNKYILRE